MALFAIMSSQAIFLVFTGTPLYFALFPFMGLLFTLNTFIKGYRLKRAMNKNLDAWFGFIASVLGSTFAIVSLYGSVAGTLFHFSFFLGPWLFLTSSCFAVVYHLAMLGINLFRAYNASSTHQGMHFFQANLSHFFHLTLSAVVACTVIFTMLTPLTPVIGSACALTAIALIFANILWRIFPKPWKTLIKDYLKPSKLNLNEQPAAINSQAVFSLQTNYLNFISKNDFRNKLIKWDHCALINTKTYAQGLTYVRFVMQQKIKNLSAITDSGKKNEHKKELLIHLLKSLNKDSSSPKKHLMKAYPLAFQSFWAQKGDTEQIVDAFYLLKEKNLIEKDEEFEQSSFSPLSK